MPFGVTNGPASFSQLVSVILSGIPFHVAQAYLDILVSGADFKEPGFDIFTAEAAWIEALCAEVFHMKSRS